MQKVSKINNQQVFGTAMGSPVSAFIANMVMEDVERYVDDVIAAVSGNEAERPLSHLNSVKLLIKFTNE